MRTIERSKSHGEVFTPPELCNEILDKLPEETWIDSTKTFLDPSCGNGNFLVEIKRRLLENGHDIDNVLSRIYGVDIMLDNCLECIERLYGYTEGDLRVITDNLPNGVLAYFYRGNKMLNIVQADALNYDFEFNHSLSDDTLVDEAPDFILESGASELLEDIKQSATMDKESYVATAISPEVPQPVVTNSITNPSVPKKPAPRMPGFMTIRQWAKYKLEHANDEEDIY